MKKAKLTIVSNNGNVTTLELLANISDFSNFKHLENFNRKIDEGHVKKLIKSMQTYGTSSSTCIVIETYAFDGVRTLYIADGQHRFIACSRLKLGIDVKIVKLKEDTQTNVIKYIAQMNNSAKPWGNNVYLTSFDNAGVKEYKMFNNLITQYGFKPCDMHQIFNVSSTDFREGVMQFPNEKDSLDLLEQVLRVKEIIPNKTYSRRALYKVMRIAKDYKKFANQLIKVYEVMKSKNEKFHEKETELYKDLLVIYHTIS